VDRMKCIKCNTKNSLKELNGNTGQCKKCEHEFVFDPAEMKFRSEITDDLFEELITEISANSTIYFTPIQLYYLLEKRLRSNINSYSPIFGYVCWGALLASMSIWIVNWLSLDLGLVVPIIIILYTIFVMIVVAQAATSRQASRKIRQNSIKIFQILSVIIPLFGVPLSIITKTSIGIVGSICLGLIAAGLSFAFKQPQSQIFDGFLIDRNDFRVWLTRWININGFPKKILKLRKISTDQVAPSPKVIAYKFDRVVVCDSPEIAQLLLKNNFHFQNNCAVMAINRYPHRDFMTIKAMLDLTPDLKVFAFHDCSPEGLRMIRHLRTEKIWFPDLSIPIISVATLPRHIINNPDILIPQSAKSQKLAQQLAPDLRNILDPTELAWLDAGFYLELESFSPQDLIQMLQQGITKSHQLLEIEDGDPIVMISPGFYTVRSLY
jgi:hypothetical protein